MVSTSQDGRRPTIQLVWTVLVAVACIRNVVLAQNACISDENCQHNEFCDLGVGNCILCLDCSLYKRNSTDAECPKNVFRDCGGCLEGFEQHIEGGSMQSDVSIVHEVCQPIVESQPTDQSITSTSEAGKTTTTRLATTAETTTKLSTTSATTTRVTDSNVQMTDKSVKGVKPYPHSADSTSTILTRTVSDLFGVPPTNHTALGYDEFDAKRPWIYVGIAVTFFVLCGTCGVVGFKVYLLPRQLKLKAELRKLRAIERAEMKTRKTKEDIASASKEEIERLYSDHGQDSTPLILRSYLSKSARETSH